MKLNFKDWFRLEEGKKKMATGSSTMSGGGGVTGSGQTTSTNGSNGNGGATDTGDVATHVGTYGLWCPQCHRRGHHKKDCKYGKRKNSDKCRKTPK